MTALREAIFAAVEARLQALDGIAEVERLPSGDPLSFPALHIFDGGHQIGENEAGATRYDLSITVEGYIEQSSGAEAHAALHDLYTATVHAMLPDPPLGGLAETIDEGGIRIDVAPLASARRLAFALDFFIGFSAARGDPAQPA